MGRNCGWLTAQTAKYYRERISQRRFLPEILIDKKRWDIDAIYIPETDFDFKSEVDRLKHVMDKKDGVNIFLSEGAGLDTIVREIENSGEEVPRDAFGHIRLDEINPGQWFAKQFSQELNAEKTLVQKSGYFARSAKANDQDLDLIRKSASFAVDRALNNESGLSGLDDNLDGELNLIEFKRIKGGKPFDKNTDWVQSMLQPINQK